MKILHWLKMNLKENKNLLNTSRFVHGRFEKLLWKRKLKELAYEVIFTLLKLLSICTLSVYQKYVLESLKRNKKIIFQAVKDTCLRKASLILIMKWQSDGLTTEGPEYRNLIMDGIKKHFYSNSFVQTDFINIFHNE